MRLAITGGTGLVGRFLVNEALRAGDEVTVLTRRAPEGGFFDGEVRHVAYDLDGEVPELAGADAVIHAAFDHVPGRYRGGEGEDAAGFLARNLDGSLRLFRAAERAGARVVFLSTRAVYGPQDGMLSEEMACRPDTLYGQAKLKAEQALLASGQPATILRATGVYGAPGPGQRHKWADLFEDFAAGKPIPARAGTEVHGDDLAAAMRLGLNGTGGVFNVSDLLLDRREMLAEWQRLTEVSGDLPPAADLGGYNEMRTDRLRDLGWRPGGWGRLTATLGQMAGQSGFPPKRA
ncbi:NAD(P)-dependent oxidoreductase [Paracoccus sp. SCSIO 75233]|uniref:NAD-dependent epimerase/dehydratase family protein n=1 Tax=Paracoccus sp. SCSIO 75233 TaxID=3017782 RepID=UPI0022F06998|nr:NAD(P)-dependent oxidoreductase [Paracoccus sp. SCSIO 75233]WBU52572.1 NAD(P)-dependent oxidoreductase [Paracoccus sp. SCSIO 75233]